tara:strand:+ start:1969 stop:3084 length:1116 start_codon:yes stop_codon:yes gene_type:complete
MNFCTIKQMNEQDALVIQPYLKLKRYDKDYLLNEGINLLRAINLKCVFSQAVGLDDIHPRTFFRSGYVGFLLKTIKTKKVDIIFVNTNLTPIQQRSLEEKIKCKVIDRTGLILEIFGSRARSNEGKLSVMLASLRYQKSRLVRSWTHLERQRGGAGFMGGPGEKQIESDRRQLTNQINRIKKKIVSIDSIRNSQRNRRRKNNQPIISLVGYTNSGKSTLFNKLTKSSVLSKNMLFSSLDSTIRKSYLGNMYFIFVDTVGFIRDLPTTLIDAFKSTLDEVIYSDIILHVRDISNNQDYFQKQEVFKILEEIGISKKDKRIIDVMNKVDLLEGAGHLKQGLNTNKGLFVSATNGFGIDNLKNRILCSINSSDK